VKWISKIKQEGNPPPLKKTLKSVSYWCAVQIRFGQFALSLCFVSCDCKKVENCEAKAKAYNTRIAPQVACRNCRGAGHDTERAGVGPIGSRLSLQPQADLWPTSQTHASALAFNGLHPRNPCNFL